MMAGEAQSGYDKNCTSIEIESSTNSHFSDLIQRLTKMAKNPSIESDLSQSLDEFLQKLNDCDQFLEHGIFTMNFAEAALLLQSSADIYSKKVDLLWDIIFDYQKRILLSDDQNKSKEQELENLEDRKRKYKRKRQTNENQTRRTKLVNQFSFDNPETFDYLNQTYEKSSVIESWEKINIQEATINDNHTGDILNKNNQFLPNDSIYNEDNEYLGRYDQFHSASLIEDIFSLEETHDFNVEKQIPDTNVIEKYLTCESSKKCPVENFYCDLEKTFPKDPRIVLDKLPSDLVQQQPRRCSFADSLFGDDHLSSVSDIENSTPTACDNIHQENEEIGAILRNQISSSIEEQMKCSEDIEVIPYDQIEASIEERRKYIEDNGGIPYEQIAGSVDKRNKSCSQDSAFFELDDSTRGTPFSRSRSVSKTPNVLPRQPRNVKRKSFMDELTADDFKEEIKKKRKKRISPQMIKKLSSGVTANYREFEKFCRVHYKPEENEGTVPPELTDSEDSDDNAEDSEEEDDEEEEREPFEDVGIDQDEDEEDENEANELPQTPTDNLAISTASELLESSHEPLISTPSTSRVAEVSERTKTTALAELASEDLEAEEISRNNVKEWRTFILPIIKKMDSKSDFDIHEYGSNIIEPMKIGEERGFKDIVAGKNAAEVARYFIATLQLANTNNVEITGAVPGQVANETFNVKALDKTRHHELLEDYQAPSEETFRERLERAKAMNPHKALHSTPFQPPPVKKTKVACYSRKKLY